MDDWMHGWLSVGIGCLLAVAWAYGRLLHARGPLPIGLRALRHARGPAGLLPTNDQHTHSPNHASTHPSHHPSAHSPTLLFTNPFVHQPIHSSTHTSIHPHTHSPAYPFTHINIHPSIHQSIHPSIRVNEWVGERQCG